MISLLRDTAHICDNYKLFGIFFSKGSEKFLDNILKLTDEDPSMLMTGVNLNAHH